jgi:hypothetical protein
VDECRLLAAGESAALEPAGHRGRAVQVDPVKPKLEPHGTKRLNLICDVLLSNFAFKFNLRQYTLVVLFGLYRQLAPKRVKPKVERCRLTL